MRSRAWFALAACAGVVACDDADPEEAATPSEHVTVPAGDFYMGCNATLDKRCDSDEGPQHLVTLSAFSIDKTEVTAAQFKACVAAGACTVPETCSWGPDYRTYGAAGKGKHPVNCVSWGQADAYCAWAGGRLCSEAEWEKAARGGCETVAEPCAANMRTYPWGEAAATCALAVMNDAGGDANNGCGTGTAPVGSRATGASPYGVLDMAGSVWEWTSDWYGRSYYETSPQADPEGPASGTGRAFVGGSFDGAASAMRAANRLGNNPADANASLGFRCCGDVP